MDEIMSVTKNQNLLLNLRDQGEEAYYTDSTECSMDPDLYKAVTRGNILEFIKAMEKGPYVPLAPQKNTTLHLATTFGHYEIVKIICKDRPFSVEERNVKGDTALHIAARAGNALISGLLLNSGYVDGGLQEKNNDGNTPLHEALWHRHEETARGLINKSKDAAFGFNKDGKSVVYLAAEAGYASIVEVLIENSLGNYSTGDARCSEKSPLHVAISRRHIDVVRILWEKDQACFHLRCELGMNPLHHASSVGFLQGVNFLLNKFPAFAHQRDKNGLFPIHIACSKGHTNIIHEILHYCPDSRELLTFQSHNIIHVAAKSGKIKALNYLLGIPELYMLMNERDEDGNTPLHIATIFGHPKLVLALALDKRTKLDLENNRGLTSLDIAEEDKTSFSKRLAWTGLSIAGARHSNSFKSCERSLFVGHIETESCREKINVILLVATLVATMTFTPGFSVPGGYNNNSNSDQGIATMLQRVKFQVFIICNTIAMYNSIFVAIILLWAQLGDTPTMQKTLIIALPMLGIALTMMLIAFMAGVYLIVSPLSWLAHMVFLIGLNFIVAIVALFVPLCFVGSRKRHGFINNLSYYPFLLMLYMFGRSNSEDNE